MSTPPAQSKAKVELGQKDRQNVKKCKTNGKTCLHGQNVCTPEGTGSEGDMWAPAHSQAVLRVGADREAEYLRPTEDPKMVATCGTLASHH